MAQETITSVVMFADVAGSTAIYENLGNELARERIAKALNMLISITKRHKGVLVKTIGDEILVYFTDVDMAVLAARTIQETMEDDSSPETIGVLIRIGMQYGSAILEDNDIFGDTVNIAARVVGMAKARQVLCTQEIAFKLSNPELSSSMRPYDRIRVKGRDEPLDIYILAWEEEGDITNMATASSFTNPAHHIQMQKLTLSHGENKYLITNEAISYMIGRGLDCDLTIIGELISRHHSKIEHRRGKFIITDHSTNGTFVQPTEGQEVFLRGEELTLIGSGGIGLGRSVKKGEPDLHFLCE
ncbi:MAG: adenylate/guanylate cyclase domain-containing protein [Proteobacteria bacterium]|nr:adenylate/guanylate cyclase domain-containing protein [Pseudomonadota bacterium]MCH8106028.1 adenylate/guanylate cyclase domain-containing protein [Pseudomonadota bacterium]